MDRSFNIIALDTSLENCSVALQYKGKIREFFGVSNKERSTKLLHIIDKCLHGQSFIDLQAIAFAAGPGSLTGLKIASSVIQGLSTVYDLPIIKVSTLHALALQAYEEIHQFKTNFTNKNVKFIMPCIDAKMSQVYCSLYKIDNQNSTGNNISLSSNVSYLSKLECIYSDSLISLQDLSFLEHEEKIKQHINTTDEILIVGDHSWLLKQKLPKSIVCRLKIYDKLICYSAKNIIKIADYLYKNYGIISLSKDAIPLYIRSYN